MKESLYILLSGFGMDTRFYAGGFKSLETIRKCEGCGCTIENQISETGTRIELHHLGRLGFGPILWSWGLILREDIAHHFTNSGLTGFELGKVTISGWYGDPKKPLPEITPNYQEIVVKSRVTLNEPPKIGSACSKCGAQQYGFPKGANEKLDQGVIVDLSSWDGSDLTAIEGYTIKFFSEKAVRVALEAGLGKFSRFVQVEKYRTWENFDLRKWELKDYRKYQDSFMIKTIKDLNQQLSVGFQPTLRIRYY
jgi:hypothetical protein